MKLFKTKPPTKLDAPFNDAQTITPHTPIPISPVDHSFESAWHRWYNAFKQILPTYIATHLAFFVTSCLAVLFLRPDFDWRNFPLYTLWQSWFRWDTGHFVHIATYGYTDAWRTTFFPLYPLLIKAVAPLTHNPFTAELLISNIALLVVSMVLYQLVCEDFDRERADRAVLYLSVFPTAFFLAVGYNESLFLCLALLCFYQMRRGKWWLAGLFGLFASLTRSAGLFLALPFCFEYLRQHEFRWRALRFSGLSVALIPAGLVAFSLFCYLRFGDWLAFSHAQAHWQRHFELPWDGMLGSIQAIQSSTGLLSFQALRNLLDLGPDLFVLALIILSLVGPWRFPRTHLAYSLYAAVLYLFFHFVPNGGTGLYPLESMSRFMLEIFPAFIVLATLGSHRLIHRPYLMVASAILFFLLLQFLTGHWVI